MHLCIDRLPTAGYCSGVSQIPLRSVLLGMVAMPGFRDNFLVMIVSTASRPTVLSQLVD
jgi:hypothetical protein